MPILRKGKDIIFADNMNHTESIKALNMAIK
jgi:7-keto-8-aminopelargonate synthetase-like enzyme